MLIALVASVALTTPVPTPTTSALQPCKWEDGSGQRVCVWDGQHMGNDRGRSFIVRRTGKRLQHETFTYIPHSVAHALLMSR